MQINGCFVKKTLFDCVTPLTQLSCEHGGNDTKEDGCYENDDKRTNPDKHKPL